MLKNWRKHRWLVPLLPFYCGLATQVLAQTFSVLHQISPVAQKARRCGTMIISRTRSPGHRRNPRDKGGKASLIPRRKDVLALPVTDLDAASK